jgi:hypothetical protein
MDGTWLTYRELAGRLGVSVEAARRRALRARWARQSGNDGKARVHLPEDYEIDRRPDGAPDARPDASVTNDGHAALVSSLESHINTLRADNDALRQDLVAGRAELEAERARTSAAIEAFRDLADRLDAIAAERARPWWRRFTG